MLLEKVGIASRQLEDWYVTLFLQTRWWDKTGSNYLIACEGHQWSSIHIKSPFKKILQSLLCFQDILIKLCVCVCVCVYWGFWTSEIKIFPYCTLRVYLIKIANGLARYKVKLLLRSLSMAEQLLLSLLFTTCFLFLSTIFKSTLDSGLEFLKLRRTC